jgi:hypothetical protein
MGDNHCKRCHLESDVGVARNFDRTAAMTVMTKFPTAARWMRLRREPPYDAMIGARSDDLDR